MLGLLYVFALCVCLGACYTSVVKKKIGYNERQFLSSINTIIISQLFVTIHQQLEVLFLLYTSNNRQHIQDLAYFSGVLFASNHFLVRSCTCRPRLQLCCSISSCLLFYIRYSGYKKACGTIFS